MNKLKPCPFCGATPRIKTKRLCPDTVFTIDQLHYPDCFLHGFTEPENEGYVSSDAAISSWNRRADHFRDVAKMVDREELLKVADEIEESDVDDCVDWHERIRKALGVVER